MWHARPMSHHQSSFLPVFQAQFPATKKAISQVVKFLWNSAFQMGTFDSADQLSEYIETCIFKTRNHIFTSLLLSCSLLGSTNQKGSCPSLDLTLLSIPSKKASRNDILRTTSGQLQESVTT